MNDIDSSLLWEKTLSLLKIDASQGEYSTLLKNTMLLSLQDNKAIIAVPSVTIMSMIAKKFLTPIKKILDKETGQNVSIDFVAKDIASLKAEKQDVVTPLFYETPLKPKSFGHLNRVRPEYTFKALAVSSSNQLAYTSAIAVSKNLGTSYNPLFIYGPVGVGKTHLMQAIANDAYEKDPSRKIIYITSEEFTNEVVDAIRTNQTQALKRKFRSTALLIIDDVQFIAGKERVQEELFHTFNILIDNGAQIVLSSDRPPSEIKKLEKRLMSRFSGGLTVDIETPDLELKIAILQIKAKKLGIELSMEVAQTLAENAEDTRSLEGSLLRLLSKAQTNNEDITTELAKESSFQKELSKTTRAHPDDVLKKVCEYYGIKSTQLKGPKRDASLVKARQVAMFLLRKELRLPLTEIGNLLGGRDHSTIMYGVDKIAKLATNSPRFHEDMMGITKFIWG